MNQPDPTLAALRRGALAGARSLTLRGGLTVFPPEIIGLADTLEVLDLSNNALEALPDDLNRLHRLRVLFCSGNRFRMLPPVLGACASLSQIGFRDAGLREIPAESLPPLLRWLTVTGNHLQAVPAALGERPLLQKLMLSGNRLCALPDSLAGAPSLELLRLSANRFDALPGWIGTLPRLAWLAWAGNGSDGDDRAGQAATIDWRSLAVGSLLGEGASGRVHRAAWQQAGGGERAVAVKLFRGAMTSDGLPEREMEACLLAGDHPNLAGGLGRIENHPDGASGLVMRLLPDTWRVLAGPPSLESCTRDVYAPGFSLAPEAALRLAACVARAGAHLHACGLSHGDLYAHNVLWDGRCGEAVLSDLGASALLPPGAQGRVVQGFDVLAWAILVGELLDRCGPGPGTDRLRALQAACLVPRAAERPDFAALSGSLADILAGSTPAIGEPVAGRVGPV